MSMQPETNHKNPPWQNMGDFQKAALFETEWSCQDKRKFLKDINFLTSPKNQDVLRRQHSKLVDQILGFNIKEIEQYLVNRARTILPMGDYTVLGPKIHQGVQTWVGLDPETLQTPYSEILRILKILNPKDGETVVDLGAAYGRMGIVLHHLRAHAKFIGIEHAPERVIEGQRIFDSLNCPELKMQQANLSDPKFELPQAQYYFIYDYGYHPHIANTLENLNHMSEKSPFKLVVRGTATLGMIQKNYLHWERVYEGKNEELFSIYQCQAF